MSNAEWVTGTHRDCSAGYEIGLQRGGWMGLEGGAEGGGGAVVVVDEVRGVGKGGGCKGGGVAPVCVAVATLPPVQIFCNTSHKINLRKSLKNSKKLSRFLNPLIHGVTPLRA